LVGEDFTAGAIARSDGHQFVLADVCGVDDGSWCDSGCTQYADT
jgi:hypothetical protein